MNKRIVVTLSLCTLATLIAIGGVIALAAVADPAVFHLAPAATSQARPTARPVNDFSRWMDQYHAVQDDPYALADFAAKQRGKWVTWEGYVVGACATSCTSPALYIAVAPSDTTFDSASLSFLPVNFQKVPIGSWVRAQGRISLVNIGQPFLENCRILDVAPSAGGTR